MKCPDALLLDAGNTLLFPDYHVMAELLAASGHAVDAAALRAGQVHAHRAYVARLGSGGAHEDGWYSLMRAWVCAAGLREDQADGAVRELRAAHDRANLWSCVPEGVAEALARMRAAGVPLAIVSNSEGGLHALLERVGLTPLFDLVIDSSREGVSKPDPEIFRRACERLGVEPVRCLYAGDLHEVDVVGARRAGLEAALVDALDGYPDYREAPRFVSVMALVDAIVLG
jgi:putative hydrolase of the HAD superfamily